ncbi:NTP transferase domain-containing protein [Nocardioides sp. zg-1308]|uniref:molybdenum cofactor guanylyltransferase n=1 Tax=Nocardioides sp. zg-1308 TaxID=2736253 RepID=UPI001554769F|nr:NTP transferase domain-containing protein [Nocardioides sp. zg-1308]NPD04615.1 NTP transferase domain-containing protein [Nocardioides sp. zg-1308]
MDLDPAAGFCGVVIAGGTAARMGGVDKASIELDGRTLLAHALDALVDAVEVVVVAPTAVPTERPVTTVLEDPPRGGPVAGLLTGVDALRHRPTLVGVLAVDMPRVTAATMRRLREAAAGRDGAFLVGADGRRQLAGVLDAARLGGVRPDAEGQHGMALHRLLAPLDLAEVPATDDEALDVDSWSDLRELGG